MQRLAIDQDQVLADLLGEWVARYNYDYNDNLKPDDVIHWNWDGLVKPECGDKIYSYLDDPELFENLPIIDGSQQVVEELSKYYEIFVVTAPWNAENVVPKSKWLKQHFDFIPETNYVFTRNKSIVYADWLLDDKAQNFVGFSGTGLLFDAPHNRDVDGWIRLCNWQEVREWFLG
jgi:5'-nucleotidase